MQQCYWKLHPDVVVQLFKDVGILYVISATFRSGRGAVVVSSVCNILTWACKKCENTLLDQTDESLKSFNKEE